MTGPSPRAIQWIRVPAGTPKMRCSHETCQRTIYFVTTASGKQAPVNCDVEGGVRPSAPLKPGQLTMFPRRGEEEVEHDGKGLSHFADCPAALHYRRRR